jgi:hypothetical protein
MPFYLALSKGAYGDGGKCMFNAILPRRGLLSPQFCGSNKKQYDRQMFLHSSKAGRGKQGNAANRTSRVSSRTLGFLLWQVF